MIVVFHEKVFGSRRSLLEWHSFSHQILYDVGDGSRVRYWQDRWCGETSLPVTYPELFRFCQDKEASVAELMKSTNGVLSGM